MKWVFILLFIVTTALVVLLKNKPYAVIIYCICLELIALIYLLTYKAFPVLTNNSILDILLGLVVGILVFVMELFILFMIKYKAVVIDLPFYFRGNVNYFSFLISFIVLIHEEIIWRYVLLSIGFNYTLSLLLGAVLFGLCHIYFGKIQIISKFFLGLLLGIIYIVSSSLLLVIVIHSTYNFFIIKKQGSF